MRAHQLRPGAPAPHRGSSGCPCSPTRAATAPRKTPHFTPGAHTHRWRLIDPALVSGARSSEGTRRGRLTWTPGEVALDTALRPTEVLDKLRLVQRRQQGARALPDPGVRQQPVRGFAVSLSEPIVVLRDEARVAEEETEEERSPRRRRRVPTGRKICFRALVGWKGHARSAHGSRHVSPGKAVAGDVPRA